MQWRMTIDLTDMDDFAAVIDVYTSFFRSGPPARATVGIAALPKGASVEIDAIIALDRD
jgi:2-iminobutanoate/2-iminopropanoate deaminase